ncbi:hypothetical protein Hanom_Chr05g00439421 [Helianthus anomalus]
MVAKELGFDWGEGYDMRVMYAEFLDVLVYNYIKNKKFSAVSCQDVVRNAGTTIAREEVVITSTTMKQVQDLADYAMYAGSNWRGMKRLMKRTFNFERAAKSVHEANQSVLKHVRKQQNSSKTLPN